MLCGLALFLPGTKDRKLLELIPKGVVYGILTFVGLAGVLPETGNQFSKRCLLFFVPPSWHSPDEQYTKVPLWKMHLFTVLQAGALCMCWVIEYPQEAHTSYL